MSRPGDRPSCGTCTWTTRSRPCRTGAYTSARSELRQISCARGRRAKNGDDSSPEGFMNEMPTLSLDGPILQALLDLLPGTLHVKDRDYRYCIVNRGYLERWGATPEQVIGRTSEE